MNLRQRYKKLKMTNLRLRATQPNYIMLGYPRAEKIAISKDVQIHHVFSSEQEYKCFIHHHQEEMLMELAKMLQPHVNFKAEEDVYGGVVHLKASIDIVKK